METILRWLAGVLAGILEKYHDPMLQAKLDKVNADAAAQEQKLKEAQEAERQSAIATDNSIKSRIEWDRLLAESRAKESAAEQQLRASQDRVNQLNDDNRAAKKKLDDLTGGDRVRVDL